MSGLIDRLALISDEQCKYHKWKESDIEVNEVTNTKVTLGWCFLCKINFTTFQRCWCECVYVRACMYHVGQVLYSGICRRYNDLQTHTHTGVRSWFCDGVAVHCNRIWRERHTEIYECMSSPLTASGALLTGALSNTSIPLITLWPKTGHFLKKTKKTILSPYIPFLFAVFFDF